jgi:hypothetical protein
LKIEKEETQVERISEENRKYYKNGKSEKKRVKRQKHIEKSE